MSRLRGSAIEQHGEFKSLTYSLEQRNWKRIDVERASGRTGANKACLVTQDCSQ